LQSYRFCVQHLDIIIVIFLFSLSTFCGFQGCFNKFTNYVQENLNIVIGTVVGIAAVQLLAIIFAFCVCRVSRSRVKYLSQWWASPSYSPSAFAG
jgi:hypothetical protein